MVKHYVMWIEFAMLCLLVYQINCHPNAAQHLRYKCNSDDAACRFEFERKMHPADQKRENIHKQDNERSEEKTSSYWNRLAQSTLREHLQKDLNRKCVAKNVIFFLGDGMSIPTITASRIFVGQKYGKPGESSRLSFEKFPFVGLSKTYCIDKQVPDSACTATAYLCGVKGNYETVGVNGRVKLNDCKAEQVPTNRVDSLAAWAQKAGKGTGIVTTTTVTHASPAGAYAHSSNRAFECDGDVEMSGQDPADCEDIASQLIHSKTGKKFKVIMGGGRTKFLPNTTDDGYGNKGERLDGRNLIEHWVHSKKNKNATYVTDKSGLDDLDIPDTDYLLGLFAPSHMEYNVDRDPEKQPSLAEMTEKAIKMLQKEKNGYFLFVEGGEIDFGHHAAEAVKALNETVELSNAVKRAVKLTDRKDTLIVVTADHAHTMSINGYPDRGNPITGRNSELSDVDNLPMITLSYGNGPGYGFIYHENGTRKDLSATEFNKDVVYPGLFPTELETHGGDDVGVFALGCMSHLFSGVYEQNTIPHLINYASCMGEGLTVCNQND